jgi:hypothetical protein
MGSDPGNNQYVDFVNRDIGKIVECVVPAGREGLPNLISTKQASRLLPFGLLFLIVTRYSKAGEANASWTRRPSTMFCRP